jgi:hypothetical protein
LFSLSLSLSLSLFTFLKQARADTFYKPGYFLVRLV